MNTWQIFHNYGYLTVLTLCSHISYSLPAHQPVCTCIPEIFHQSESFTLPIYLVLISLLEGPDLSLVSFRLLHSSLRSNSEGETRNGTELMIHSSLDEEITDWKCSMFWLTAWTSLTSLLYWNVRLSPYQECDHLVFLFLSFKSSFNFLWSLPCLWMRFLLKIKFTRMLKTDLTIHHWIVGSKRY